MVKWVYGYMGIWVYSYIVIGYVVDRSKKEALFMLVQVLRPLHDMVYGGVFQKVQFPCREHPTILI